MNLNPSDNLSGKRVLIMGLGALGGAVIATRYFCEHGATVQVTDLRSAETLADSIDALRGFSIDFVLGEHRANDFLTADLVIVNPAVPYDSPYIKSMTESAIPFTSEMNVFLQRCSLPVIGVTGSNGKSTTTSMVHHILDCAKLPNWVGGNLGKSLLGDYEIFNTKAGHVVLELSSFQLHAMDQIKYSPEIAIVSNLSPNHLDWHKSLEHYYQSKQVISKYQSDSDYLILNADDKLLCNWASTSSATVMYYSVQKPIERGAWLQDGKLYYRLDNSETKVLCQRSDLKLPGDFNVANFLSASLAALLAGARPEDIPRAAKSFRGLEHRLELCHSHQGIDFINDSIATTPESTIAGITAIEQPLVLILGGKDKETDFAPLAKVIAQASHIQAVILLGVCREKINQALQSATVKIPIHICDNFESAVQTASQEATAGSAVLLSPACASYDMFKHFQERGKRFKTLVQQWQQ